MSSLLKENKKAPAFNLTDREGSKHRLSSIEADFVVLFFYPKDSTPGCTIESRSFSSRIKKFEKEGVQVIGISGGDQKSKEKFCSKHKLKTLMLSDNDFAISKKYGVYGPKKFMGKSYDGISRVTYVLDEDKKIIKVFDKVKPAVHADEVLKFIKEYKANS